MERLVSFCFALALAYAESDKLCLTDVNAALQNDINSLNTAVGNLVELLRVSGNTLPCASDADCQKDGDAAATCDQYLCSCTMDRQYVDGAQVCPQPPTSAPTIEIPEDGWFTIWECNGEDSPGRALTEDWQQLAMEATAVRICSADDLEDCVTAYGGIPLDSLRSGSLSLQRADASCNYGCVSEQWHGTQTRLQQLTWSCAPKDGIMFHACGNGDGLHIDEENHCTWVHGEAKEDIVVQLYREPFVWRTAWACETGDAATDRLKRNDIKYLANVASMVRICTTGSEEDCVLSSSAPLDTLRTGLLKAQRTGLDSCNLDCVKEDWEGPANRLNQMTWSCPTERDDRLETAMYWACGNSGGLHLTARETSEAPKCDWDYQDSKDDISVQLYTPEELSGWRTFWECRSSETTPNYRLKDADFQEVAMSSTSVRICSMGDEEKCVQSSKGALESLRAGKEEAQRNLSSCNLDCVKGEWSGPDDLLKALTWTCPPKNQNLIFHACGNSYGLHLSNVNKDLCDWGFSGTNDDITVQLYQTPFQWYTIWECQSEGAKEDILRDDWQALALKSSKVRICTRDNLYSSYTKDCVVSSGGALQTLRGGKLQAQTIQENCNLACIKGEWTGSDERLAQMTWTCPPGDHDLIYHACGNGAGLHLGNGHCNWKHATKTDDIVVQLFAPVE